MGYRKCAAREISAGSEYGYNTNLYYAYENEKSSVSVFWDAFMRTVFITVEKKTAVPAVKAVETMQPAVVAPNFTQMELHDGMCYILQLANGEYILVDGGAQKEEAVERLYAILKEKAPTGKPKIALWIFTHSDDDHIGLATEFLSKYKDKVEVAAFSYQFINCDKVQVAMGDMPRMKAEIQAFETAIAGSYPNAVVYTLLPTSNGQALYSSSRLFSPLQNFLNHHCTVRLLAVPGPNTLLMLRVVSTALPSILNLSKKIS